MRKLAVVFKILLALSVFFSFSIFTITYYSEKRLLNHRKRDVHTKYILFWTGIKNFHLPNTNGNDLFEQHCSWKNCFITEDKNLIPVDEYDAIMFFIPTSTDHPKETLPTKRNPHQRYIFVNSESPIRFHDSNAQYVYNNFYNWTMTYRFDSDIVRRHGEIVKKNRNYKMPTKEDVSQKNGSVAWIVSNCNSANRREQIAKNLGKYIKVDVFGRCGTKKCPNDGDCYDYVAKHYKFYLSFENSYCVDYTTEKFIKVLQRDLVPIVYGGGNYAAIAPQYSYINVEDFSSTEALANYLKWLEQDLDNYLKYFEWKHTHDIHKRGLNVICKLCEMLNNPELPPKTYEDIKEWWYGKEMANCKSGVQLPLIALEEPNL